MAGVKGQVGFRPLQSELCPPPSLRSKDALDLLDMVDVVSGYHADDVFDRFLSALGMLAVELPLIRRKRFEERKIRFTHDAVQFDGFARIAFFVVSCDDPGILIEGLNGDSWGSKDGAHAPADYDFNVGEVGQDFGNRPLIGRGALAEFGGGCAVDQTR